MIEENNDRRILKSLIDKLDTPTDNDGAASVIVYNTIIKILNKISLYRIMNKSKEFWLPESDPYGA